MQRHFDDQLSDFKKKIIEMAALTEESIAKSIESLKNRDGKLAEEIITADEKIDELELVIDEMGLELIALHQPMAVDLRFIMTGLKINGELERIADLAVDICQRVLQLVDKPMLKPLIDIPKLADIAQKMVHMSIDAFVNQDVELAKKVCLNDDAADKLRNIIQDELINDYMAKDGTTAPRAVALLLIARHLERICDQTTNIAENVIYMVQAKVVKHHPENL
jgi:phosphate transport system protein